MVGCSFGVLLIFYVLSVMFFMVSFTGLAGFQLVLILMHCSVSGPYFVLFTAQHLFLHWLGIFFFWEGHYALYTSLLVQSAFMF